MLARILRRTGVGIVLMLGMVITLVDNSSSAVQRIVLEGDVWPPYVMDSRGGQNGFIVDVAKAALATSGYEVVYLNIPWTRALIDTSSGRCDGAVGIYYSDAKQRKFILPEEELGISKNKFFVRQDSSWKYYGIQSLEGIRLGVIDSYDYGEVNAYIDAQRKAGSPQVSFMFGDKALERNIKKLIMGDRIDAIIEDQLVVGYVCTQMGLSAALKEAGTVLPYSKVGVAFAPGKSISVTHAAALSAGVRQLRASGELRVILEKYHLGDWKSVQ
jgi:polar amino acid transport system substrate-binding protein